LFVPATLASTNVVPISFGNVQPPVAPPLPFLARFLWWTACECDRFRRAGARGGAITTSDVDRLDFDLDGPPWRPPPFLN
jgi:hypothetical protein